MNYHRESGAVSLFIVIFTALLVTIITIGFSQLILRNQQQASRADLSQSAYDSALAGVEDAKRALVMERQCSVASEDGVRGVDSCLRLQEAIASEECNTLNDIFDFGAKGERPIQSANVGGEVFDQATTCVKIYPNTPDYKGPNLSSDKSQLVPLRVAPGESFNKIELSWFTREDVEGAGGVSPTMTLPGDSGVSAPLLPEGQASWGANTPPLVRAQLIQTGPTFSLSDFDDNSNSNTIFLYPSNINQPRSFDPRPRKESGGTDSKPQQVICDKSRFITGGYACSVTLDLPLPKGVSDAKDRTAYLRLSGLYNTARYKIELLNGSDPVDFYGVQPEVDSTGRTNDLFRRVKARVQLESSNFPYPEQALYLYGSLCKNFFIASSVDDYVPECNLGT